MNTLLLLIFLCLPVSAWAAFPQVADFAESGDTEGTSHTVTLPSNIAAGNLLAIQMTCRNAATVISTPANWTRNVTVNASVSVAFFYILSAVGDEGASVAVSTDLSVACSWISYRITGHDPATAPEHGTPATALSSVEPNPPSLTPSWGASDTLWIAWFGITTNVTISDYPDNYTSNQILSHSAGTSNAATGSASRETNTTVQDPTTFTISASNNWAAITTAIRTAPAAILISPPVPPVLFSQ